MALLRFSRKRVNILKQCSAPRESIERVVVVPHVSTGVFLKMMEYLCLDGFVLGDLDGSSREELDALADMYMLEGLRLLLSGNDGL